MYGVCGTVKAGVCADVERFSDDMLAALTDKTEGGGTEDRGKTVSRDGARTDREQQQRKGKEKLRCVAVSAAVPAGVAWLMALHHPRTRPPSLDPPPSRNPLPRS